jgi:hypothetical protein
MPDKPNTEYVTCTVCWVRVRLRRDMKMMKHDRVPFGARRKKNPDKEQCPGTYTSRWSRTL